MVRTHARARCLLFRPLASAANRLYLSVHRGHSVGYIYPLKPFPLLTKGTSPSRHKLLPHAISVLQKAGYKLVTLSECLGKPAYKSTGSPAKRDVSADPDYLLFL